jgi:perosamine synthetase
VKLRTVPPTGIPVKLTDILRLLGARLNSPKSAEELRSIVTEIAGARHIAFINSGRAANYTILKILKNMSGDDKNEVIIPAFTCYSVGASIVRAGLKIRAVDIDPLTLDYNYANLKAADLAKTLAILSCNLFGLVSDWKQINSIKKDSSIFTIDDSAQTLGLPFDGLNSGAMGDIGFYSLGRGKNITTYSGGIILTNRDDLARAIEAEIAKYDKPGIAQEAFILLMLLSYGLLLRPSYYWIPNNLPFLRLGHTEYDTEFKVMQFSKLQYSLGPIMFSKLKAVNEIRSRNVENIANRVYSMGKFQIPGPKDGKLPFIRLPLLAPDRKTRDNVVNRLCLNGIMSSGMYPSTIPQIPQIKEFWVNKNDRFNGAEKVVDCLFTLPTHPYVKQKDIDKMIDCLKSV